MKIFERTKGLTWGDGSGNRYKIYVNSGTIVTDAAFSPGSIAPLNTLAFTAPAGASSGVAGKGFTFTTGAGGGGNANGGPFTVTLGAGTGTGTSGQLSIVPAAGNGVNIGTVAIGSTSASILVPDNTTTIHFIRLTQNFAGTLNAPSGNSARMLGVDAHWVDATNSVATMAGIYAFAYHDAVSGVTDLIGMIGRAFITSTGTSTNMYGVRGDVNFTGAGTVTNASGVLSQGGSNTAAGVITTYSGFRSGALNFTTLGLTVTDGYGAFISMPSNASGNNIGVQIGTQVAGVIASLGLLVGSNGAWFRGTAPTPLVDTSGGAATVAIYAGSSAGANTALCALYYYRSSSVMAYTGFDNSTASIAGHTKDVTDYVVAPNNQRSILVDSSKNVWMAGTLAVGGTSTANWGLGSTGKVTTYNQVATAGWGNPSIVAQARTVGAVAAVASVAAYTVGAADGSFVVSANVLVTTATTHAFTVTCAYTDEGNTARTLTMTFGLVAGGVAVTSIANGNGTVPYQGVPLHIRCKAATTITIASAGGGTYTAVVYNIEGMIQQVA